MKVNGLMTKDEAKEFYYGQMDKIMKDNGLMSKEKAKEF